MGDESVINTTVDLTANASMPFQFDQNGFMSTDVHLPLWAGAGIGLSHSDTGHLPRSQRLQNKFQFHIGPFLRWKLNEDQFSVNPSFGISWTWQLNYRFSLRVLFSAKGNFRSDAQDPSDPKQELPYSALTGGLQFLIYPFNMSANNPNESQNSTHIIFGPQLGAFYEQNRSGGKGQWNIMADPLGIGIGIHIL